jgi:hypothetical protein
MQKKLSTLALISATAFSTPLFGQSFYSTQTLFPTTTGTPLRDSIVRHYKPLNVLTYDNARDVMYGVIHKVRDSVECIYSGHKRYHTPGTDPSTNMADGGSANGINAEHAYPQSKGAASGNAQANMHHLFPARAGANSARSNWPYNNVAASQTNSWFYLNQETPTAPTTNIDAYSRLRTNLYFEPRKQSKGNIARAIFYFYTMYKAEADLADPNFFIQQRDTLCTWHMLDPVDSTEWQRTWEIAAYQSGKPNPFILDCSLVKRMYCNTIITNPCMATSIDETWQQTVEMVQAYPNPASHQANIFVQLLQPAQVRVSILDLLGREITVITDEYREAGEQLWQWQPSENLGNGMYFYRVQINGQQQATHKIQLLR